MQQPPEESRALDQLGREIREAKGVDEQRGEPVQGVNIAVAWRLSVELVVGVGVGMTMGYFLDKWLDSSPWFLMLGLVIGSIAGFRNMLRATKNL